MPSPFSGITPLSFLQTFVLELMNVREQTGPADEQLIERIGRSAGKFFEDSFREEYGKQGPLTPEEYADAIIGLKNHIGGNFSLASGQPGCIRVINTACPFGEGVKNAPELCRMTSSVFGGIAARNFGYARVVLERRIAQNDGRCEVCIYTDPELAKGQPGVEYQPEVHAGSKAIGELQADIEERMGQIWRQYGTRQGRQDAGAGPLIVAQSPAMRQVLRAVETVAPTPATVLIRGETGVGKELIARAIHALSPRHRKPFVAVNCGAIPESLIESALFGHEKGAFTGAVDVHQGYFERAQGGTLFLDEVDALSPAAQTKLLRVVQEGELERVGGHRDIQVDARVVAASNADLALAVEEGRFRKDLYYRLNVVRLFIPPLAERPEDLPQLVQTILKRLGQRYGKPALSVSGKVMEQLRGHTWPGNVRELENILERAALFSESDVLQKVELDRPSAAPCGDGGKSARRQAVAKADREQLERALQRYQGNVAQAARWLELTPRAVYQKIAAYGLDVSRYRVVRG
ncbi:MAG TPA: sigma 54-interacting transcriptional regulator [Methylococcaceae bacterium]|nr:sigma 54-interacting transcriptional regulator [Methylococcaceae bacterium]